ncbi:MAG TPA: STAS/SEC14 domain-containing protein [Syntrophales bacterium]|nr:STAS/SEC14 domain-containing protein [Syntrophales bacterium]
MAVTYEKESSGLYILRISGVLTDRDRRGMEAAGRADIDRGTKIKILILTEQFAGWGREGDWGDIRFMLEYDPFMEKIAVVGDEKWRELFLMYLAAGHRNAAVEYFPMGQEARARSWLI